MNLFARKIVTVVILVSLTSAIGCGPSADSEFVAASNDTNIKKIASAYQLYASRFDYRGPKSKEELKSFLLENESISKNLDLIGFDKSKIDEYFVSENDGKPFEFRWEVFINPDRDRTKEPIVFEREGKNGIRLVILSNRKILEVDDDKQYQRLLAGKVGVEEGKTELEQEEDAEGDPE